MEFKHTSVLFDEVIDNLEIKADGIYVDGTLGGGGHASGVCEKLSKDGMLIGIDRDKDALEAASKCLEKYPCKKQYVQSNYSSIKDVLKDLNINGIDGAILDLGVSSFQLDNEERGFSYMKDTALDMRMNQDDSFTAWDVVNDYDEKRLFEIIRDYGEEKWASRIARFICDYRKGKTVDSTGELVEIIKSAIPASARRDGPHPAKRTFQAIRIEVNDELTQLKKAIGEFCDCLNSGGRLCIITFHSLEDRIVKQGFAKLVNPCTCPPEFPICVCGKKASIKKMQGKAICPSKQELEANPRSRSAKLRVIEKL